MRFLSKTLTLAVSLSVALACGKKSGSASKGEPNAGPGDDGGPGPTGEGQGEGSGSGSGSLPIQPGTLALVDFSVVPVSSSQGAGLLAHERNVSPEYKPGDLALAIGASLTRGPGLKLIGTYPTVPHPEQTSSAVPDSLRIFVRKIYLKKSAQDGIAVLFESPTPAPIDFLPDGSTDLSKLVTAANSSPTGLRLAVDIELNAVRLGVEATGEYDRIVVDYQTAADIKGCVHAEWDDNLLGGTGNVTAAHHTFCTRAGKSSFDSGTFSAAQFEVVDADHDGKPDDEAEAAQEMKVNLSRMWNSGQELPTGHFETEYKLPVPVKLEVDVVSRLSMIVDLNRMLRFFRNEGGSGNHPIPGAPSSATFFNTVWDDSSYVTVGSPGRIYGFEYLARACAPQNYVNDSSCTGGFFDIGGWLTLIMDRNGKPVSALMQPDDDNALTVTKGSSRGPLLESGFIVAGTAPDTVDIKYDITGAGDACGQVGGAILGFSTATALDAIETFSSSPIQLEFAAQKCQNPPNEAQDDPFKGPIYLTRGL